MVTSASRHSGSGQVTRVLLVEDSPGDAGLIQHALGTGRGVEVVWVESLKAATAHATTVPMDCAVLDLGLPDAQGFEALDMMRRAAPAVPVVVLTGDSDPRRGVEAVKRGADDYLHKGDLNSRMLRQTVDFAIERRRSRTALRRSEAFARNVLACLGEGVVVHDTEGRLVTANPAAVALLGRAFDDPTGESAEAGWRVVGLDGAEVPAADHPSAVALRTGEPVSGVLLGVDHPYGGRRWVEADAHLLADDDGAPYGVVSSYRDVTRRVAAEDEMRRLSAIVSSTADAVMGTTVDGVVTSWNEPAERLFGYRPDEVLGRSMRLLIGEGDADDTSLLLRSIARGEPVTNVETTRARKDGERVSVSITVSPVYDADGNVTGTSTIARDVGDRNRMLGELRHSALHDALTGLPNRQLLTDRLAQAAARARRHGGSVAVLFVDLDHFKLINDAAGHDVGDKVLVEVARRITGAVRAEDTVARFGGDEFVVVCVDGTVGSSSDTAQRVLAAFRDPVEVDDQRLHVTASIGVALAPPSDVESLLSSADVAMYDAKARGRARAQMFDETLAQEAAERLELSNDLRDALANGELDLHYQPIVDLATGALVGLEALARWDHPRRGPLSPAQFVGLADEIGLSGALDRWALRRGVGDIAALRAAGAVPADCYVSVNVTARSLREPSLERWVTDVVAATGLPPGALMLELTETGLMDDPDEARERLVRLRDGGVGVAIDDFGTGYSSLAYLGRFSVVTLKIDRSFVERMLDSHDDLAIVAAISDLARAVGVRTVAEGIETVEQAQLLRRLGCNAGQGFVWAPAVPARDIAALVARQPRGRFRVPGGPPTRVDRRGDDELAGLCAVHGFTRLLALHRDGASPSTIAAALNAEDFRTPRGNRWHRLTVARALEAAVNPYVGAS